MDRSQDERARPRAGWWIYVLECHGGVLYTGIAKDVAARFERHARGIGARFTRMHPPLRILGQAGLATRGEALSAEHALKRLSREEKLRWLEAGLESFVASRRAG